MNRAADYDSRRQLAELRNRGVAQRADDRRNQIAERVGLAHDVGRFESLVGQERLERLHQPPVARGRKVAANRVVADRDRGIGAAGFLDRLEKQNRSEGLGLIAALSGGKPRQAWRSVGADDCDSAVGGAEIETDRLNFARGASAGTFLHHGVSRSGRAELLSTLSIAHILAKPSG